MLGLLVILVISWGLLYLFEREDLNVLGIMPSPKRIVQFLIGIIVISFILLINIYQETLVRNLVWKVNEFQYATIWNAFVYHLRSSLTEDLIFRGALLYILIKRIGTYKAILLSSIIFGVYHWFSYGILQERFILLFYIFFITGCNGFVWGYAFHKTKSVMLGLGLHIGSNLVLSCFYVSQPFGEIIFSLASETELTGWINFFYSFFKGLFPAFSTLIFVQFWIKFDRKTKNKWNFSAKTK
jgi:membrane protease YdiL (CAAX protease family)